MLSLKERKEKVNQIWNCLSKKCGSCNIISIFRESTSETYLVIFSITIWYKKFTFQKKLYKSWEQLQLH